MRKLGSIKNIEEFLLAIARGADVNETRKDKPLVEYYFTELMHLYAVPGPENEVALKKFQALVAAGADVKTIINGQPEGVEDFYHLTRETMLRLQLFSTLLKSAQAKEIIAGSQAHRAMLPPLKEQLFHALDILKRMEEESHGKS